MDSVWVRRRTIPAFPALCMLLLRCVSSLCPSGPSSPSIHYQAPLVSKHNTNTTQSCAYPNAHELANVLRCHTPQRGDGVLSCRPLVAATATSTSATTNSCTCTALLLLACRVAGVAGDVLLCVNVHIVAPRECWGQLVYAALVDGRRLLVDKWTTGGWRSDSRK